KDTRRRKIYWARVVRGNQVWAPGAHWVYQRARRAHSTIAQKGAKVDGDLRARCQSNRRSRTYLTAKGWSVVRPPRLRNFPGMRFIWQWLAIGLLAGVGCNRAAAPVSDFGAERQRMVQEQVMPRGNREQRVLAAMARVPREEFVPPDE